MRCSSPVRIKDPNDSKNYIYVRCGHCTACHIEYQNYWRLRAVYEMQKHDWNLWCALTYDDVHLSLQNLEYEQDVRFSHLGRLGKIDSLEKDEMKLFWKRLRKALAPMRIRYMQCGEYGDRFGRPHYHAIIFGLSPDHPIFKGFLYVPSRKGYVGHLPQWPFGEFWFSSKPADEKNAAYLAKYIHKKKTGKMKRVYEEQNINSEFFSVSNRPGVGSEVIDENAKYFFNHPYVQVNGRKMNMPRYMVERLNDMNGDFKEIHRYEVMQHLKASNFNGEQQERNLKRVVQD